MKMSLSISKGNGNIKHNKRQQKNKPNNVDSEKSEDNITLIDENIKKIYNEEFSDSVNEYNAKQKRNDRKIKDYYSKISNDKKTKTFQELVIQIGNKEEQVLDEQLTNKIYKEFVDEFVERNSNLKVIGAYIHNDETTPHLHIDYVPIATYERGLKKRVSNDKAIKQMGFENWNDWKDFNFQSLERVCSLNGITRLNKNNCDKHIANVQEFKEVAKAKEILREEKAQLDIKQRELTVEREKLEDELSYLKKLDKAKNNLNKHKDTVYDVLDPQKSNFSSSKVKVENEKLELLANKWISLNENNDLLQANNLVLSSRNKELSNQLENLKKEKKELENKTINYENLQNRYNRLIELQPSLTAVQNEKELLIKNKNLEQKVTELTEQNKKLQEENYQLGFDNKKLNFKHECLKQNYESLIKRFDEFKDSVVDMFRKLFNRGELGVQDTLEEMDYSLNETLIEVKDDLVDEFKEEQIIYK